MCVFHLNLRTTIKRQWQTYLLQKSSILFWTWKLWHLCKYFDGFPSSAWTAALLYGRKTHSDVFDSRWQKRINNNLISISTLHCKIINLNAFRLKKKTLYMNFIFKIYFLYLKENVMMVSRLSYRLCEKDGKFCSQQIKLSTNAKCIYLLSRS